MTTELLNEQTKIENFINESPDFLSAFSFANIFLWKDYFSFELNIIHSNLCIFAKNQIGCFLYLPPLGVNVSKETIEECFLYMNSINDGSGVSRIENIGAQQLSLYQGEKFSYYKKGYEYYYYKNDIVSLKGNEYKSKRSSYNYFIKNYSSKFISYDDSMFDECINLYSVWAKKRKESSDNDIYKHMIDENYNVHKLALRNFKKLNFVGRVVLVEGKIKAYTFGVQLAKETFCILFEIADLSIKGLPVFIFRKLCSDGELKNYKFINAMDDFELNNLQNAKLSFKPKILFPSYTVKMKG